MNKAQTEAPKNGREGGHLLLFGFTKLSEMMAKGNVWYVRHYERYFRQVTVCYLDGYWDHEEEQGDTQLISVGGSNRTWLNLLLSPWRLRRLVSRIQPDAFLTADIVFSWWHSLLLRSHPVLMPVCIPSEIYAGSGRSISGLPIWLEKLFIRLSFLSATKIIMGQNSDASIAWLLSDSIAAKKLLVVPATVEEFPPQDFFDRLLARSRAVLDRPVILLYVGRLHPEKKVVDLVYMLSHLCQKGLAVRLVIAGDGSERDVMEKIATELQVHDIIDWLGYVDNSDLPAIYNRADIFVSTVTGTALREAGLSRLPVVAYNIDWVKYLLKHENTALLAEAGNPISLAEQVELMINDASLRENCAMAFHSEAVKRWSPEIIGVALQHHVFGCTKEM